MNHSIGDNIGESIGNISESIGNIGESIGKTGETIITPSSSINWQMIALVVVVLGILGLNVFMYLAKGTDLVTYFLGKMSSILSQFIQLIEKGTDRTVDLTKRGIDEVVETKQLDETLNEKKEVSADVVPNSTDAKKIQSGNKKGWCYVGTDRDYRSCLKINKSDTCASGEMYDSKQQCEQPELRYN